MPLSPVCLVQDAAGPFVPTLNGVNVGQGHTIGIQLADNTSATGWFLQVLGTDELSTAPTLASVNPTTHQVTTVGTTVTFTFPAALGRALLFQSQVTGPGGPITTTFAIFTLIANNRVGAVGMTRENDPNFGWTAVVNPIVRATAVPFNLSSAMTANSSFGANATVNYALTESIIADSSASVNLDPVGQATSKTAFISTAFITKPPNAASWDLTVNPTAHTPNGAAPANILDHPAGYGVLIQGTAVGAHEWATALFMHRSTNHRWTALIDLPVFDDFFGGVLAGIYIFDSVANRAVFFGRANGALTQLAVLHIDFANWATTTQFTGALYRSSTPIWLQVFDDGTNFQFFYSFDGYNFSSSVLTESRTAFLSAAGDYVGWGGTAQNGAGNGPGKHMSVWLGSWTMV